MNCSCIINPLSGGKAGPKVKTIFHQLNERSDYNFHIFDLTIHNSSADMEKAFSYPTVLIAGGDGTVSSLLPYAVKSEAKIGIIPLGTGNDLAKELGVYKRFSISRFEEFIKYYKTAPVRSLTVWQLRDESPDPKEVLFCNYTSFGFDASIVRDFSSWRDAGPPVLLRNVWGNRLGYAAACLKNFSTGFLSSGQLRFDNDSKYEVKEKKIRSFFFANIRSVMGLGISNTSGSPFDDQLEVIVVERFREYFSMISQYWIPAFKEVAVVKCDGCEISNLPSKTCLQIDGEARTDFASEKYIIKSAGRIRIMVDLPDDNH